MAKRYHNSGGMIGNAPGQQANMPTGITKKNYPTNPSINGKYDDTVAGIDRQISDDIKGINKQSNKTEKY